MPEAQCIKYPIKPGRRETLVDWIKGLEDSGEELAEAMAEGGFLVEGVFLERSQSGDHLLLYTSAQDLQAAFDALSRSKVPLVQEFDRVMAESVDLENAVSLELVYHTP